jgi:hypothetical protein
MAFYVGTLVAGAAWPPDPDELGERLGRLRWFRWDEGAPEGGWVLRLAVEDPTSRWAAAIGATDVLVREA